MLSNKLPNLMFFYTIFIFKLAYKISLIKQLSKTTGIIKQIFLCIYGP